MLKVVVFALFFLFSIIKINYGASIVMTKAKLNSTINDLALCNDGTESAFYYWKPTSTSNSKYRFWLLHLMGGDWCYSIETCQERWQNSTVLMTSKYWPKNIVKTGIFDNNVTLNPLAEAYKVYAPYCSSDAWMGNKTASDETGGWYFRGQTILHSIVETLIYDDKYPFLKQNDELGIIDVLFFSGCSAGARGTMSNLEFLPGVIKNIFMKYDRTFNSNNLILYGILDSALWINVEPFNPTITPISFANQTQDAYWFVNASGVVVGSNCLVEYDIDDEYDYWQCILGQYRIPAIPKSSPFIINMAQYDAAQLSYNEDGNDEPWTYTNKQIDYADDVFRDTMRNTLLYAIENSVNSTIFSTACFHHCVTEEVNFWNITIITFNDTNGFFIEEYHSFSSYLRYFINTKMSEYYYDDADVSLNEYLEANDNYKLIENCTTGINCGGGCASEKDPYTMYHIDALAEP